MALLMLGTFLCTCAAVVWNCMIFIIERDLLRCFMVTSIVTHREYPPPAFPDRIYAQSSCLMMEQRSMIPLQSNSVITVSLKPKLQFIIYIYIYSRSINNYFIYIIYLCLKFNPLFLFIELHKLLFHHQIQAFNDLIQWKLKTCLRNSCDMMVTSMNKLIECR